VLFVVVATPRCSIMTVFLVLPPGLSRQLVFVVGLCRCGSTTVDGCVSSSTNAKVEVCFWGLGLLMIIDCWLGFEMFLIIDSVSTNENRFCIRFVNNVLHLD